MSTKAKRTRPRRNTEVSTYKIVIYRNELIEQERVIGKAYREMTKHVRGLNRPQPSYWPMSRQMDLDANQSLVSFHGTKVATATAVTLFLRQLDKVASDTLYRQYATRATRYLAKQMMEVRP